MSVAELVKAELQDKGRLRPAEFAAHIGCHREGVHWYMRQMLDSGIVEKVKERGLSGRPLEAYRVVHWDGLEDWQPPAGKDPVTFQWDGLMAAFGIRIVNIDLPAHPHVLAWEAA